MANVSPWRHEELKNSTSFLIVEKQSLKSSSVETTKVVALPEAFLCACVYNDDGMQKNYGTNYFPQFTLWTLPCGKWVPWHFLVRAHLEWSVSQMFAFLNWLRFLGWSHAQDHLSVRLMNDWDLSKQSCVYPVAEHENLSIGVKWYWHFRQASFS